MQSVQIVYSFHRFVGEPERREDFFAGQLAEASEDDASNWVDKGLARAMPSQGESDQ